MDKQCGTECTQTKGTYGVVSLQMFLLAFKALEILKDPRSLLWMESQFSSLAE